MKSTVDATGTRVRVLVADSNQIQAQLLTSALRRHPSFQVISCKADQSECLKALQTHPADIILFGDLMQAESSNRFAVLRALHAAYPQAQLVLLLDSDGDRDFVVNAFRSGVKGLFCRTSQPFKALCRCILSVYAGQVWASSEQLRYLIDAVTRAPAMRVVNARGDTLLTPREEQVVSLIAEGLSNREAALRMQITENTVKKSLLRIFDKLGISNRVELVLYALTHRATCVPERVPQRIPSQASVPLDADTEQFETTSA